MGQMCASDSDPSPQSRPNPNPWPQPDPDPDPGSLIGVSVHVRKKASNGSCYDGVGGATVRIPGAAVETDITDAKGLAIFAVRSAGSYTVSVSGAGVTSQSRTVYMSGEHVSVDFCLTVPASNTSCTPRCLYGYCDSDCDGWFDHIEEQFGYDKCNPNSPSFPPDSPSTICYKVSAARKDIESLEDRIAQGQARQLVTSIDPAFDPFLDLYEDGLCDLAVPQPDPDCVGVGGCREDEILVAPNACCPVSTPYLDDTMNCSAQP